METIKVEQCDRDAAYGAYFECYEDTPNDLWLEALRAGKHDDDPQVQIIAAVRIAERERNAGKVEERASACRMAGDQGGIDPIEAQILYEHLSEAAQAIREQSNGA